MFSSWSGLTPTGRAQDKLLQCRLLSPLRSLDHDSLDLFVLPSLDVFFLLLIIAVEIMSAAEVCKGSCQLHLSSKLAPKTETKGKNH